MQRQSDGIYQSVSFIENSLTDALSLDSLAEKAYFSRTHYQRLFRSVVGEPVMEYVKKRRLQQACRALGESDASVLELAILHGYESYEGFSRAFKAYFGMSPQRYRNVGFIRREEKNMLSTELKGSIARHTGEIVKALGIITTDYEQLAKAAADVGKEAGIEGATAILLAEEYGQLAKRMDGFIRGINTGHTDGLSVFDVCDGVERLVKQLDGIVFQMNILQLFTAKEIARIAVPARDGFASIVNGANELLGKAMETREIIMQTINELTNLLRGEIKKDTEDHQNQAIALLQKLASEGMVLTADTKAAALAAGEYGRGFMCIAMDLEKRVGAVKAVTEAAGNFSSNRKKVDASLKKMEYATFMTNINAFNAKVETARSGNREDFAACTRRILQYPAQMEEARQKCVELFDESVKLMQLAEQNKEHKEIPANQLFQRAVEDILFQSDILATQTRVEAERCNRDSFRVIAVKTDEALSVLENALNGDLQNDLEAVTAYNKALSDITGEYKKAVIDAGNHGVAHAVNADEYAHLAKRINYCIIEAEARK
jgi:AraC-like DNA-binding protein